RIAQGFIATPQREPFEPEQVFECRRIPSGRTTNLADLGGNLAGVLRDIKARHTADTGATPQQAIGNVRNIVAQGCYRPYAGNPHRAPWLHRVFSVPAPLWQKAESRTQKADKRAPLSKRCTLSG